MLRPEPCARPSSGLRPSTNTGPVEALHQAAGHNAEHAAMPVLAVVDQRGGGVVHRADSLAGLADLRFHLLALGVLIVKLLRQLAGARRVVGEEQLDHRIGRIHAAGGIHARRDLKRHLARGGDAYRR